jgi:LysR family transcriptional regulator, glycine cleavage system transcriptional activator
MSKNIPPLGALRAFEAASRHGSFVRAAEEIHVTPAAISHQIKQLEHWIGMQLFERSARGVTLTTAGLEYAARIREAFDRLMMSSAAARSNRTRAIVTVRALHGIASMWLVPRVVAFAKENPGIDVRLLSDVIDLNPGKSGSDISIYHKRPELDGYEQRLLLHSTFSLYASPALVPEPREMTPAEILNYPLIHNSYEDRDWQYPTLEDWFRAQSFQPPPILPGLRFARGEFAASACAMGAGLALLQDAFCASMLHKGLIVKLPGPTIPSPHPYYTLIKTNPSEEVQLVHDWLLREGEPWR